MSRVSRKEDQFYERFHELAVDVCASSAVYAEVAAHFPEMNYRISEIKEYETRCDTRVKETLTLLETSFITPFDREDIAALVRMLDEVADGMEGVSARWNLYDIDEMRPEAIRMAELTREACIHLEELFARFKNFKHDPEITERVTAVGRLEDEGDIVSRNGLATIFREKTDAVEVIKWKSLLEYMEDTLDACKGVVNIVRAVVIKNA